VGVRNDILNRNRATRAVRCAVKLVQFRVPSAGRRATVVKVLKWTSVAVLVLAALPYAWGPIYTFPQPAAFAGAHFFNPYADLRGTWQRANLHAHGRAWSGITNGQQPDEEVVAHYQQLGYTVAGISDYERIATLHGVPTIPIYEHGYNIGKHHQLAIGAHRVEWFDFLLLQSLSHEQYIIDRVGKDSDLVAIAHPSLRGAYSRDDMEKLTGYQLIDVVNGPDEQDSLWDAALSSGHIVWGLANDDTHDVNDPRRTAVAWNMIDSPTADTSDVVDALRNGRTYAVAKKKSAADARDTRVRAVGVDAGRLVVTCYGAPATFVFIGQNGNVRRTVKDSLMAEYTFSNDDTYIRTVIHTPGTTVFLNPVLRYDGARLPQPVSTVEAGATWLLRGVSLLCGAGAIAAIARRRRAAMPPPVSAHAFSAPKRRTA